MLLAIINTRSLGGSLNLQRELKKKKKEKEEWVAEADIYTLEN